MLMKKFVFLTIILLSHVAQSATRTDIFTCPKLSTQQGVQQHAALQRALSIRLFSGHPSELAQLKPDNADTEDTGPAYWSMGASDRAYWYVCNYENGQINYKLPKTYVKCVNLGYVKKQDVLRCQ